MTTRWAPIILCMLVGLAAAKPVPLEPYDASGKLTVLLPTGWKVTADLDKGVVSAQQDPDRNDAAVLLVIIQPTATATEDQLLDAIAGSVSKDLKVARRDTLPGGRGRLLIADGTIDKIQARIGAIAVVANGSSVITLLASRTTEFDKLGGIELVTTVLTSMKATAAPPSAPPAPPQGIQAPAVDANGRLVVPPLGRKVALAELAGEWRQDDSSIASYVTSSTGAYGGFDSIAITANWTLDAKGNAFSSSVATTAGRGGAHQVVEKKYGTATLAPNMVLSIAWQNGTTQHYLLRGWVELPAITVITLNGPWYQGGVPSDVLGDPKIGTNLNAQWARKRAAK